MNHINSRGIGTYSILPDYSNFTMYEMYLNQSWRLGAKAAQSLTAQNTTDHVGVTFLFLCLICQLVHYTTRLEPVPHAFKWV